jgi:hypothetical protein
MNKENIKLLHDVLIEFDRWPLWIDGFSINSCLGMPRYCYGNEMRPGREGLQKNSRLLDFAIIADLSGFAASLNSGPGVLTHYRPYGMENDTEILKLAVFFFGSSDVLDALIHDETDDFLFNLDDAARVLKYCLVEENPTSEQIEKQWWRGHVRRR